MITRHVLYVASLDEEPGVWLERLEPLRRLGLEELDLTAVLAPDRLWRSVPKRVQERVLSGAGSPVHRHLESLLGEVHRHGLAGRVLMDGLPSHELAFETATKAGADLLVAALPADPGGEVGHFLASPVPLLLLPGDCRLEPEQPPLLPWNHPLECGAMLEVVRALVTAGVAPAKLQLLRCGSDTGRDDSFGTVAATALHERIEAEGFEVHSSWAAGAAAAAALDAARDARGGLVIVTRPERYGPHDPWDQTIVERVAQSRQRPVLVLPPAAGLLKSNDDAPGGRAENRA